MVGSVSGRSRNNASDRPASAKRRRMQGTSMFAEEDRLRKRVLEAAQLLRELVAGAFGGAGDALHAELEVVGIAGVFHRDLVGDQPLLQQIVERLVEGLHAVLRGSLVE